ncbi:MAG: hypothetical protein HRU17_21905 [Polyangiaceae bacterium]|nr:hypothetical protein [Polyangiaceae bacterium]
MGLALTLVANALPVKRYIAQLGFNISSASDLGSFGWRLLEAPGKWYNASDADVPSLRLDIKFKHFSKLQQRARQIREFGLNTQVGRSQWVRAKLNADGKQLRVKVRLQGIFSDHFATDKWSFAVKVRNGKSLYGMRRFGLKSPITRKLPNPLLWQEVYQLLDVPVLTRRFRPVNVTLNGKHLGLMVIEERWAKELVESQERPEGVFFKLLTMRFPEAKLADLQISPYALGKLVESATQSATLALAQRTWEGVRHGQVSPRQAFDPETTGAYLALVDFWGLYHPITGHNVRLYFDPLAARFEFVPYDYAEGKLGSLPTRRIVLTSWLLADPVIFGHYTSNFRKLVRLDQRGTITARLRTVERTQLAYLHRQLPLLGTADLANNASLLKLALTPPKLTDTRVASAAPKPPAKTITTRFKSWLGVRSVSPTDFRNLWLIRNPILVEVNAAGTQLNFFSSSETDVQILSAKWHPNGRPPMPLLHRPLLLPGRHSYQLDAGFNYPIPGTDGTVSGVGEIRGTVLVDGSTRAFAVRPIRKSPAPTAVDPAHTLQRNPFISPSATGRLLTIPKGSWAVDGDILVPQGTELVIEAGATLRFEPGAVLISRGQLTIQGTADERVLLAARESPGTWGGVAVVRVPTRSVWSHATIEDTTGVKHQGWNLRGGTTFYRSDVRLRSCRFRKNLAEDALNIVHSDFEIYDLSIADAASDGFDADFSSGFIHGGEFVRIGATGGGDAIDVSGTVMTARDLRIHQINDKALSAGERSRLEASRLSISHVGTGAVSKDGSKLWLQDSTIHAVSMVALMAYVKKDTYGPAQLTATNVRVKGATRAALTQTGSTLAYNGRQIPPQELDIDQLYKTYMKSSRLN